MTATTNLSAALKTLNAATEHNETPSDGLYVELHNADGSIACKSTLSEFLASAAKAIMTNNTLQSISKILATDGTNVGGANNEIIANAVAGGWTVKDLTKDQTYYLFENGIYALHELSDGEYGIFIINGWHHVANKMYGPGTYIRLKSQDDSLNYGMVILPGTIEDQRIRVKAHANITLKYKKLAF
jgi:hypothetical protein